MFIEKSIEIYYEPHAAKFGNFLQHLSLGALTTILAVFSKLT